MSAAGHVHSTEPTGYWIVNRTIPEVPTAYRAIGGPISQGGDTECFSEDTWLQRDICSREAFPFRDKSIDFAICSHTLEDIRDPLWVCSELIRVAKRGYIEVPSREWETCRGSERPNEVGLSHHRWLIDVSGKRLRFLMKFHLIHSHWRFSLPRSHAMQRVGRRRSNKSSGCGGKTVSTSRKSSSMASGIWSES